MNALLLLAPLSLFLETGLPIGLFVPGGDTLLLALGALAAEGGLEAFPLLPSSSWEASSATSWATPWGATGARPSGAASPRTSGKRASASPSAMAPSSSSSPPSSGGAHPHALPLRGLGLPLLPLPPLGGPGKPPLDPGAFPSGLLPGAAPPPLGHPLRASPPRGIGLLLSRRPYSAG